MKRSVGGDFTKINLAWLNWWLKGDLTAAGKGLLVGADGCSWVYGFNRSSNERPVTHRQRMGRCKVGL